MAAAKTAGEAAVLPRMIDAIVLVAATGIVANPLVIAVDVRSFGVIWPVAEGACVFLGAGLGGARPGISRGRWTVRGNVTATHVASTAALLALALRTSSAG